MTHERLEKKKLRQHPSRLAQRRSLGKGEVESFRLGEVRIVLEKVLEITHRDVDLWSSSRWCRSRSSPGSELVRPAGCTRLFLHVNNDRRSLVPVFGCLDTCTHEENEDGG